MNKIGQIWIETVLYTLIGLALIALVLSFVNPRINGMKEQLLVEQTVDAMNALDVKMGEISSSPSNVRIVEFTLKNGELYVDGNSSEIRIVISNLKEMFSEPGVEVSSGATKIITEKNQNGYTTSIKLNYPLLNITYSGKNEIKKFSAAQLPYKLSLANRGIAGNKYNLDIANI